MPWAEDVGFCADGFQADSLPSSLARHPYCFFVSNSRATFLAFTCSSGGLGS